MYTHLATRGFLDPYCFSALKDVTKQHQYMQEHSQVGTVAS